MLTKCKIEYEKYKTKGMRALRSKNYNKKLWIDSTNGILINLWRIAVKLRYLKKTGLFCALCGYPNPSDVHHIINKSHGLCVKYLPDNGMPLCRSCHSVAETNEIKNKIWSMLPVNIQEELMESKNNICKLTPEYIEGTYKNLCEYIETLIKAKEIEFGIKKILT